MTLKDMPHASQNAEGADAACLSILVVQLLASLRIIVISFFFFSFVQCYNDYNHLRETQSSRSMFTPSFLVEINDSVFLLSARYFIFLVDLVIL